MTKRNSILIGILLLILAVAILAGGFFAWQYFAVKNNPIAGLPVQSQQATEGWKTDISAQYGFEFKYPNGWTVIEGRYSPDTKIITNIISSPIINNLIGYESTNVYYLVKLNFDTNNKLLTNSQGFFVVPKEMGAATDAEPTNLPNSLLSKYSEYGVAQQIISTFKFTK